MVIILILISLIYAILLSIIIYTYYRDNSDLEERILILEKREGDIMPCGTKGRPKGRKGTSKGGGRKK